MKTSAVSRVKWTASPPLTRHLFSACGQIWGESQNVFLPERLFYFELQDESHVYFIYAIVLFAIPWRRSTRAFHFAIEFFSGLSASCVVSVCAAKEAESMKILNGSLTPQNHMVESGRSVRKQSRCYVANKPWAVYPISYSQQSQRVRIGRTHGVQYLLRSKRRRVYNLLRIRINLP